MLQFDSTNRSTVFKQLEKVNQYNHHFERKAAVYTQNKDRKGHLDGKGTFVQSIIMVGLCPWP